MTKAWELEGFLRAQDNQLFIGKFSAKELAERFGTPLFVFSEMRIRQNIQRLYKVEEAIDCKLKVCYAAKANSNMAILQSIRKIGCDIEVNSGGELWKALKAGFKGEQIIFNGTSKEDWEIEKAIEAEIYAIQVDSLYELSLIGKIARKMGKKANVSLRLVPEVETKTHSGLQTALSTSKFGMMPDEALFAFKNYKSCDFLNLCGIHIHIGSQNPDKSSYTNAMLFLFENLLRIEKEANVKLKHLNLGGGFPVNYLRDKTQEKDFAPSVKQIFSADFEPYEAVGEAWKEAKRNFPEVKTDDLTLLLEPGRSIIADAGICLTTVRNKKERPQNSQDKDTLNSTTTETWLLTDAGFNILLSMETYKWYYQMIHAERSCEEHSYPYKIGGPLCDGGDVYFDIEGEGRLPDYRLLPPNTKPGDLLAILNCGAYSIAQMFPYN
ncbi:MAG: diaminopimelate decarboxylase, partial [Pyrinomonadaceae bacterium]